MKEKGYWIWQTEQPLCEKQAVLLRRRFSCHGSEKAVVNLSASSRYKLYINGIYVCSGPMKGDRFRQYYDTVDVSPWLKPGENEITAAVQYYPSDYARAVTFGTGSISVVPASRGGFWLECSKLDIATDTRWQCCVDRSYTFIEACDSKYAGDMERRDGRMCGAEAFVWHDAVPLCPADTHRLGGVLYEWQLTARTLPMLSEQLIRPVEISKQSGTDFAPLLSGEAVTLPARSQTWVDLDMGELVNAYVSVPLQAAGAGATLTLEYAEGYSIPDGKGSFRKENRTDAKNGRVFGEKDVYIAAAGEQTYEPFCFRTFRYLRLWIDTGDAELMLRLPAFRMTGYPLKKDGTFSAEEPQLNKIWDISVRTLERCMLDTYVDCPYYEQMQYIMDTVIESLLTYQISADDRLVRRAIDDFAATQRPDGMIHCNAPAAFAQIIPCFAMYFADLLYYHYQYYGDKELVRKYLPTVMGILRYFWERIDPDTGLLGPTGYWSFVDWVDLWRPNHGSPVSDEAEPLYIYSHIFAYALERSAYLMEQVGWEDMAREYRQLRGQLLKNLRDTRRVDGYYPISPLETIPSQHTQLWAVLSGCVKGEEAKQLMRCCMGDRNLLQCSYSMSFYLFRAMEKSGIYDEIPEKWEPWEQMMAKNLTTWMEDAVSQRSDCHGWSAVPMYDLIAVVLGVRPEEPGYEVVSVRPMAPELGSMRADIATCKGDIRISRTVTPCAEGYHMHLEMSLPQEIPVHIYTEKSKCASFCQKNIVFDYKIIKEGEFLQ